MRFSRFLMIFSIIYIDSFSSIAGATDLKPPLIPHHALYTMNLVESYGNGGLRNARGAMTYEFKDQCDGWSVESKVYLRLQYGNLPEVENIRSMATWESKDGLIFHFRLKDENNGKLMEEIIGIAKLDGTGLGGLVEYTKPTLGGIVLPQGTIFPTTHIQSLIQYARKGGKHTTKIMFDGATLDNPYEVSGVIGIGSGGEYLSPLLLKVLDKITNWKIRMAYFPINGKKETPDIELDIEMRADGIVSRILQEFEGYSIEARLNQINFLGRADC
jgi:hypothetical protein